MKIYTIVLVLASIILSSTFAKSLPKDYKKVSGTTTEIHLKRNKRGINDTASDNQNVAYVRNPNGVVYSFQLTNVEGIRNAILMGGKISLTQPTDNDPPPQNPPQINPRVPQSPQSPQDPVQTITSWVQTPTGWAQISQAVFQTPPGWVQIPQGWVQTSTVAGQTANVVFQTPPGWVKIPQGWVQTSPVADQTANVFFPTPPGWVQTSLGWVQISQVAGQTSQVPGQTSQVPGQTPQTVWTLEEKLALFEQWLKNDSRYAQVLKSQGKNAQRVDVQGELIPAIEARIRKLEAEAATSNNGFLNKAINRYSDCLQILRKFTGFVTLGFSDVLLNNIESIFL